MRRFIVAVALAAAVAPFTPASADHACDSTVVDAAGAAYVVVDNPDNPHGGVWVYQESNGQAGLQRDDDSCAGQNGDTVIL